MSPLGLTCSSLKEEVMVVNQQQAGIVSILGSSDCDHQRPKSLRRTLSADMSSKKWLTQQGFSSLKKIASSDRFPFSITEFSSSSSSEGDEEEDRFDIWTTIQQGDKKEEIEKPGQFDIWSSIISHKVEESKTLPPPYVHPLVKRSASSLSKQSLEICTESLGSETGSDGFSSYPASEASDVEEDNKEDEPQQVMVPNINKFDMEDLQAVKYNPVTVAAATKKASPRSFPPPIPSLSTLRNGSSMRMRSHRDNGRLVLEAVSVSSQNNFHAERQDGRLVLTFVNSPKAEEAAKEGLTSDVEEKIDLGSENSEDEEELEEEELEERGRGGGGGGREEEEEEEMVFVMEQAPKLSSRVLNVHRLMMSKPMMLANRNPTWYKQAKIEDEVVVVEEEEEEEEEQEVMKPVASLAQSLPPRRPPVASSASTASSFNEYEYYWKSKPISTIAAASSGFNPLAQKVAAPLSKNYCYNNNNNHHHNKLILNNNNMKPNDQELIVLKGNKGDYLVPLLKGCKEPRRSIFFWEPHCIATS